MMRLTDNDVNIFKTFTIKNINDGQYFKNFIE